MASTAATGGVSMEGVNPTLAESKHDGAAGQDGADVVVLPKQQYEEQVQAMKELVGVLQAQVKATAEVAKAKTAPTSLALKSGPETIKAVAAAANKKGNSTVPQLLLLAMIAGGYIATGVTLAVTVGGGMDGFKMTDPGLQTYLFAALGIPFGLCMILVAGGNLLTGDIMIMPVGVLSGTATPKQLIKVWVCSFVGNFIGALLVVTILVDAAGLPSGTMQQATASAVATSKATHNFGELILRGIGCNWMVCMAVWLAFKCHTLTEKITACLIAIPTFIAIGWSHSVVNMALLPLGWLLDGDFTFWEYLGRNLFPVTLGNIVGGQFIGLTYFYLYGQRPTNAKPVQE